MPLAEEFKDMITFKFVIMGINIGAEFDFLIFMRALLAALLALMLFLRIKMLAEIHDAYNTGVYLVRNQHEIHLDF